MDVPKHLATSIKYYLTPQHEVIVKSHTNISEYDLSADVFFFAFNINLPTFIEQQEYILDFFKRYQGKICYVNTSDIGMCSRLYALYEELFKQTFCAFITTETDFARVKFKKRILYPKFTIDYIPYAQTQKHKSVYFRGSLTGTKRFEGKNYRVEALKILNQINASWNNCKLFATALQRQSLSTRDLIQDISTERLINSLPENIIVQRKDYLSELACSQSSLCLPGGAIWCYRHLESIALNCNIISLSVDYDPGYWLGRDKLDECFNIIDSDLSNLQEICEYTLNENTDLKERRDYAYSTYQQYYELTPENHYKLHIWTKLKQDMQKHSILP